MEGLARCHPARSDAWGTHTQRGWCVNTGCQLLDLRETLSKFVTLKERLTEKKLMIVNDHLLLVVSGVGLLYNLEAGGRVREKERERERERERKRERKRGEQCSYISMNTISPGLVLILLCQVCLKAHRTEHKLKIEGKRERER